MHIQHRKPLGRIHSAAHRARRSFLVLAAFLVSTTLLMQSVQAAAGNYNWQPVTAAGSRTWSPVASSSDGTKLVASVYGGYLYTTTDSGATWTERAVGGSRNWWPVTSSSDGTKLVAAAADGGYLYTSTDSGAIWTEETTAGSRNWRGLASSSDGTKLVAGVTGGNIYLGQEIVFDTGATTINVEVEPTISITTSGTVAISLTPTSGGVVSSASDTVSVSTNDSAGYNLTFSAVDATANLTNGGNTIAPGSGTWTTPATLTNNTWGYMIPGLGNFAGSYSIETNETSSSSTWAAVPGSGSAQTVKSTSTNSINDTTVFWYGVRANSTQPSGEYSCVVTYTALAK